VISQAKALSLDGAGDESSLSAVFERDRLGPEASEKIKKAAVGAVT
jgi:hypothetical protein